MVVLDEVTRAKNTGFLIHYPRLINFSKLRSPEN
jgi:hypothetical protein